MNKILNSECNVFEIQCQKKKYCTVHANSFDCLAYLIGLNYETITKIANKIYIQQFPAEIIK